MEFEKEEIIEMLRLYWRNLSRKTKPRSFRNGIWKRIENKLLDQLDEIDNKKNETRK